MTFARTDEGIFYFQLLSALGMTPQQWRELDPREAAYLATAFSEQNRRQRNELEKRGGR